MRPDRPLAVLLVAVLAMATTLPGVAAAEPEVVNRFVLRINSRVATLAEYQRRYADRVRAIRSADLEPEEREGLLDNAGREVFSEIYGELLLLSRSDQLDLEVTEDELDQEVQQTEDQMGFKSRDELIRALTASGMTMEDFRAQLRKGRLAKITRYVDVFSKIQVDDEEVRLYYRHHPEEFTTPERVRLRELVVLDTGGVSQPELRERAAAVRQQLVDGADLEEIATQGQERGRTSGLIDLDWLPVGDLDPVLAGAVRGVEPGGYSEPVAARGGLHIVQLVERDAPHVRPFSEVKEELLQKEREKRYEAEYRKYLENLEERSYIVANPPPEAVGFSRIRDEGLDTAPVEAPSAEDEGEEPAANGEAASAAG